MWLVGRKQKANNCIEFEKFVSEEKQASSLAGGRVGAREQCEIELGKQIVKCGLAASGCRIKGSAHHNHTTSYLSPTFRFHCGLCAAPLLARPRLEQQSLWDTISPAVGRILGTVQKLPV